MISRARRVRNIVWSIFAAALLCAAAGASAQTVSALDVRNALAGNSAISSRPAAIIDANEAARRLGQAQLQRRYGAEPLPGEQARRSDASVVSHSYWRRQEKLRRVVEQAQRRSNETRRPQLAQR